MIDSNWEDNSTASRFEEIAFDQTLSTELRRLAKPSVPPSRQIQAWRDYERTKFFALGRNPVPARMGYNLWDECPKYIHWARQLLDENELKWNGISHRKAPRLALARVAEALGYRYLRGLEAIESQLAGADLAVFRAQRAIFMKRMKADADMVHAENDKGQAPGRVGVVVDLFERELLSLCVWLVKIGLKYYAARMRENFVK